MKPQEILWALGLTLALIGELWGVFSRPEGDTITEWTFRSPISLALMCALICWAAWHFIFAQGAAKWIDLVFVVGGALIGVVVWVFNRPKKDKTDGHS